MGKNKEIEFLEKLKSKAMYLCDNYNKLDEDTFMKKVDEFGDFLNGHLEESGVSTKVFCETDENKELKSEYVKAVFIYDDIKFYHDLIHIEAKDTDGLVKKFQYVKNIMLPLSLLSKNLKTWTRYCKNNKRLIELQHNLKEKIDFANHLRNKIAGHLETEVISNTIQWEPFIFQEVAKGNKSAQRLVMYRSLLEAAINSYQDERTGTQKVFKKEIDLNIPFYAQIFFEYLFQTIDESIEFLQLLTSTFDSQIIYFTGIPLDIMKTAGETNFKLKSKGR